MARLKSGFFIKQLLNAFDEKSKSKLSPNHTFRMYSAHDSTIVNLLNALGLYDVMFSILKIYFVSFNINFHLNRVIYRRLLQA